MVTHYLFIAAALQKRCRIPMRKMKMMTGMNWTRMTFLNTQPQLMQQPRTKSTCQNHPHQRIVMYIKTQKIIRLVVAKQPAKGKTIRTIADRAAISVYVVAATVKCFQMSILLLKCMASQ